MPIQIPSRRIVNNSGRELHFDEFDDALVTINLAHHKIHEGEHYIATGLLNLTTTVEQWFMLRGKANATAVASHMLWGFNFSGQTILKAFECSDRSAATVTATSEATLTSLINQNRYSANTAEAFELLNISAGTLTSGTTGTTLYLERIGGGSTLGAGSGQAASARGELEFILDDTKTYIFGVKSEIASVTGSYKLNWYETGAPT